jgi:CheY-like chemotaxis protein
VESTGHEGVDSRLRGLRVLVLEDESIVLLMIEDMLGDLGCQVVGPVGTVPEALALADALSPPHDGRPILEKPFWGDALSNVLMRLLPPG